ncbi:MAG: glutamate racemase [Abditibacteriota bacterium]|nr:glutamate racemase [Abditibacteriota bacterium]
MITKIGLYDSGVGGLSVACAVRRTLPMADMVYVADTCHVPYGGRPFSDIRAFSRGISAFLVSKNVDMLIIACNVSSAVACAELRSAYPDIPVLSMIENGVSACGGYSAVGILATEGTVKSGAYPAALREAGFEGEVIQEACPEFVPLVERGLMDDPVCREACRKRCGAVKGAPAVILGCTHYPLMLPAIREFLPGSEIIDPAVALARSLEGAPCQGSGSFRCYTTGSRLQFERTASLFVKGISARELAWREGVLEENH